MGYSLKKKEAFKSVILALLDAKRISQRELATELDTSPSNLNQRILAGSMRPDMILKINEQLDVDLLGMIARYEKGEQIQSILKEELDPLKHYKRKESGSYHDLKELLETQQKSIELLSNQVQILTTQLHLWMERDLLKKKRK